jgi:hypothetical protein
VIRVALLAVLAAAPATTVTPFRTEVAPRVDPVFGDITGLRQGVDRFLALQTEMEQVRGEFSTAVHGTLAELVTPAATGRARTCPQAAVGQYTRALAAGGRYLALGRQLEARYREIRRSDELGEAAGLTPDYRVKMKRARELYLELLRDYREMRVAFYDQLGAEMRHAGCPLTTNQPRPRPADSPDGEAGPLDPSNPAAWALEEPAIEPPPKETTARPPATTAAAATAIWISIDNSHCAQKSQLSLDGASLGAIAAHKKLTIRTRAGPHDLCVLSATEKRACGEPGTLRRAYLYEGWTLVLRCADK